MQLTQFTDYSLRVLLYLGLKERRSTINEIADHFKVSKHHLTKVVHQMSKDGYVLTLRGTTGGIELAKNPKDLRIGDFVHYSEKNMNLVECFDMKTNTCPIGGFCGLQRLLGNAHRAFLDELNKMTLADLLKSEGREKRLASLKIQPQSA